MAKHDDAQAVYKRQIRILEVFVFNRIEQLGKIAEQRPAEQSACEMAQAELQDIVNTVIPSMRSVSE